MQLRCCLTATKVLCEHTAKRTNLLGVPGKRRHRALPRLVMEPAGAALLLLLSACVQGGVASLALIGLLDGGSEVAP